MVYKKLPLYKGKLKFAQIAKGMNAAVRNATRLANDAKLLLDAKRFPSAASLASLSIEESGKVSILRAMSLARDDEEIKEEWKRYRSHKSKNVQWLFPQFVAEGAKKLDDFRSLFDTKSDHSHVLDQLKQLGFYTDCLGPRANWSVPDSVIDFELAHQLVDTALILSSKSPISAREIELWAEYVGPVGRKDLDSMKTAVAKWQIAMQREGLAAADEGGMEDFLNVRTEAE